VFFAVHQKEDEFIKIFIGVSKAIDNINKIIGPDLINSNIPIIDQKAVDAFLIEHDGTHNKSKFGANSILGISFAVCKVVPVIKEYIFTFTLLICVTLKDHPL
jgi:enolase